MEHITSRQNSKDINCIFNNICGLSSTCSSCMDRGLHYLIYKHYLPKTLIPRLYYHSLDFEQEVPDINYYNSRIIDMVDKGMGIYCYSELPGTGKTTACIQSLMTFLFHDILSSPYDVDNRRVLYLNTTEFLDRLRKSYSSIDMELESLLYEMTSINRTPKLILFDDIGSERCSDWVIERLYSLINYRVSNGLASLFTSNKSIDQLYDNLGARIISRIRGCSKEVLFANPDFRGCNW